jgi:hypothetical protein
MENDREAVLAYGLTTLIDVDDHAEYVFDDHVPLDVDSPRERYTRIIWGLRACNMVYGLMRRSVLLRTEGILPIFGSDLLLLAHLSLLGRFTWIQEPTFYRRENRPGEVASDVNQRILRMVTGSSAADFGDVTSHYRVLRNRHLDLVRSELSGGARWAAHAATLYCYRNRFGVPIGAVSGIDRGLTSVPGARWLASKVGLIRPY